MSSPALSSSSTTTMTLDVSSIPNPSSCSLSQLYEFLRPVTLEPKSSFTNWAKTFQCLPSRSFLPTSTSQLPYIFELAVREGSTVRAAGAGHSPSDLACTEGFMVRTDRLDRVLQVDTERELVVVEGGMSLIALHKVLATHGLAMSNLGSISDQSIAGIVTTCTHGTGFDFGVIPTHVLALDVMLPPNSAYSAGAPDATIVTCSSTEHPDLFNASLCGLGASGFIVTVTLKVEKAFRLREVRRVIDFDEAVRDLDSLMESSEHSKIWWFPSTGKAKFFGADRTYEPAAPVGCSWFWDMFVGFHIVQLLLFLGLYLRPIIPLIGHLVLWLGGDEEKVVTDDSHKIFNLDCLFSQYTTEWSIPYDHGRACLSELKTWLDAEHADPDGLRPHFPIEIRVSSPDDIWVSPSYGRRSLWIGIVQFKPYDYAVPYRKLFNRFEHIMTQHDGRPHWAKQHPFTPTEFRRAYPHFDRFVDVLKKVDPNGLFVNPYVRRHIFGESTLGPRMFKRRA